MLVGFFGSIFRPFQGIFGMKKIASIEGAAIQTLENINFFLLFYEFVLAFFVIYALLTSITKIHLLWMRKRLKKVFGFICRAKNEILLLENSENLSDEKKLEIQLSFQETIGLICKLIEQRLFMKKIGEHNYKRILDGLNSIKEKKVDVKTQMLLLDNLIVLIKSFLK
ncbi:hypothetical protein KAT08_03680 [Candidatus Babeliales bacterium]|nr:hypothetical protein [Candidatus Babeliales bacterium]